MGKNIPIRVTGLGGINLLDDSRAIGDDELTYCKNAYPVRRGVMSKRLSRGIVGAYLGATGVKIQPVSAAIPGFLNTSVRSVAVTAYPNLTQLSYALLVDKGDGVGSGQVMRGTLRGTRPQLVSLAGFMYCFTGYIDDGVTVVPGDKAAPSGYKISPDGTISDFNFSGASNTSVFPKFAIPYKSRFVYGNFGPGFENYVVFSDNYLPAVIGDAVLASNGRNLILGGARNPDKLVGGVEVMLTGVGDPTQSALLLLCEFSAYLVTGQPNQTTDATTVLGDLDVKKFSINCGCAALETIVTTPYGVIWAGPDDVWLFREGQLPVMVGTKIRRALERTPPSARYRWSAAYFDGFYRLAIYSEGAGPDDPGGATTPDSIPPDEVYMLDLRDGAPTDYKSAKWYGPQVFYVDNDATTDKFAAVPNLVVDNRPGSAPALYSVLNPSPAASLALFLVSYEQRGARDQIAAASPIGAATADAWRSVAVDIRSKQFTVNDVELDKVYLGASLSAKVSGPCWLNIDAIMDDGAVIDSRQKTLSQDASMKLGNKIGSTAFFSSPTVVAKFGDATKRVSGKSVQLRLYDSTGFIIDNTNNMLVFSPGAAIYQVATIPQGLYATYVELFAAIATALSTAGAPAGYTVNLGGGNVCSISNGGDVALFFLAPISGITSAQLAASAALGQLLGYDIVAQDGLSPSGDFNAVNAMAFSNSAELELNSVTMTVWPRDKKPL